MLSACVEYKNQIKEQLFNVCCDVIDVGIKTLFCTSLFINLSLYLTGNLFIRIGMNRAGNALINTGFKITSLWYITR